MKRLFVITLMGLLFSVIFSAQAVAGGFHRGDIVKVMTRNQYLGANLDPVILAQSPEEFLAEVTYALNTIAANNFPLRARRLATEIALTKPDLIGLQEVFDFKLNGENPGPPFVDHLAETLEALDDKGQSYVVAATVENLDITIPLYTDGSQVPDLLRVLDRDVILFRDDDDVEVVTIVKLCEDQNPDGCNYTDVAWVPPSSLFPEIPIKRGFVAVDATVRGKTYRFVNTHLEGAGPTDPDSERKIQSLQAKELVETLQDTTLDHLPLILVGDFNSSPDDASDDLDVPYKIIVDGGFADIWDTNPLKFFDPNGLTCCQGDNLLNKTSLLDERLDLIFIRDTSFLPLAFVTGRVPIFPLSLPPNWASDHSGVFGKLIFRRGARH